MGWNSRRAWLAITAWVTTSQPQFRWKKDTNTTTKDQGIKIHDPSLEDI